ncbi:MAG: lysophospholipid acyltransferase family protein, partial [Terriglobia bacterium]
MIRTIFVISFALAYIFLVGVPCLAYTLLTGGTDPIYRAGVLGARLTVRLAGVRLEVHGRQRASIGGIVVYMANHQSNCDPPAIIGLLPPVLLLAKEKFFRVPILGRGMRLRGFIPVDRKNRERSAQAIEQAVESLRAGHSFLVFPEGTRSADGRLLPFKKGVFTMAIKAGAAIVPVSISGSRKIMAKGRMAIKPGVIRITFHEPVQSAGYAIEDLLAVQARVRQAILSGLDEEEWPACENRPDQTDARAAALRGMN